METLIEYNAAQTFEYRPITEQDGIRLLVLHPAEAATAEIHCSLVHTTLSRCEYEVIDNYTALSYVWGDASMLRSIWVDGVRVNITTNLHQALLHMRDASRPLRVWADAICIDQNNYEERGFQVGMMGKIYFGADHTIIYIGDWNQPEKPNQAEQIPSPDVAKTIAQMPWFQRVWVFQELIFSKDPWIQYGLVRWKWDRFYTSLKDAMDAINVAISDTIISDIFLPTSVQILEIPEAKGQGANQYSRDQLKVCFERVTKMNVTRQLHQGHKSPGSDMMTLVSARRGLGVTDPRDMIFAHSGFASDGDADLLQVDYSKTKEEVFTDFALHQLGKDKHCLLLFHASQWEDPSKQLQVPSWVPDWTQEIELDPQPPPPNTHGLRPPHLRHKHTASINWATHVCINTPPTLLMFGYRPEKIVHCSIPLSYRHIPEEDFVRLSNMFSKATADAKEVFGALIGYDKVRAYYDMYNAWREVIGDDEILPPLPPLPPLTAMASKHVSRGMYGRSAASFPDFNCNNSDQMRHVGSVEEFIYMPDRDSVADCLVAGFDSNFNTGFLEGRRLARFSSGVLAIVPEDAQLGDFTFLSSTQTTPYVLHFRQSHLMRLCPKPENSATDFCVRTRVESSGLAQSTRIRRQHGLSDIPIEHCKLVGSTFMHGLEFQQAVHGNRICYDQFLDTEKEGEDGFFLSETIYVVH